MLYNKNSPLWLLITGVILLILGATTLLSEMPGVNATQASQKELITPGCKQAQTIQYARCGHEVLRRVEAEAGWVGMTKEAVSAVLDAGWRMTAFSPAIIEMTRTEDLFCPQHWVLTLGGDGVPGIYRNRYGFTMERLGDASVRIRDEETRERLFRGIAFDSEEELKRWILSQ